MRKNILLAGIWLISPLIALAANDVSIGQGVDVQLSSPSMTIHLQSTGQVDSLTANADNFSVVMSNNSSITATSSTSRSLSSSGSGVTVSNQSCSSSGTAITISKTTDGATTVTINAGDSCIATSGGGGSSSGGGGGGGGGISSTPAPSPTPTPVATLPSATTPSSNPKVVELMAKLAELQAKIAQLRGSSAPTGETMAAKTPARDVAFGAKGDDIKALQALLSQDKTIYPEGTISGYFGALTRAAVKRFQKKYGISQVGRVGPLTRAKLQEVFGK